MPQKSSNFSAWVYHKVTDIEINGNLMSENLRRFPRKEIQIEVELRFLEDSARTVITRDMSEGGLFVRLNDTEHYPMGEMVSVRFKNPLADFADTEKDGIIVRHTEEGMAVAFVEMEEF